MAGQGQIVCVAEGHVCFVTPPGRISAGVDTVACFFVYFFRHCTTLTVHVWRMMQLQRATVEFVEPSWDGLLTHTAVGQHVPALSNHVSSAFGLNIHNGKVTWYSSTWGRTWTLYYMSLCCEGLDRSATWKSCSCYDVNAFNCAFKRSYLGAQALFTLFFFFLNIKTTERNNVSLSWMWAVVRCFIQF